MSDTEKAPLIVSREGNRAAPAQEKPSSSAITMFGSRPYGEVAGIQNRRAVISTLPNEDAARAPEPVIPTISTGTRSYMEKPSKKKSGVDASAAAVNVEGGGNSSSTLGRNENANNNDGGTNVKRPSGIINSWEAAARGSVSFFVPARRAAEILSLGLYSPLIDPAAAAANAAKSHHTSGMDGASTAASFVSNYSNVTAGGSPILGAHTGRKRKVIVKGANGEAVAVQQASTVISGDAFNGPSGSGAAANPMSRMSFGGAANVNGSLAKGGKTINGSGLSINEGGANGGGEPRNSFGAQSGNGSCAAAAAAGPVIVGAAGGQLVHRGDLPDSQFGATTAKKVRRAHDVQQMPEGGAVPSGGAGAYGDMANTAEYGTSSVGNHDDAAELGRTDRAFLARYGGDGGAGGGFNGTGGDAASQYGARSVHAETVFNVPGVEEHLLNALQATAIAGNDISSSCLYATGIVAGAAGKYGFISSSLVCTVLFFFRGIYSEVFSALPMNGGTYSSLLNVASKNWAALAAVLSTLSYTATAVTSAASAADYLHYGFPDVPSLPVCIGVLCFFAILTLLGMKDSANTAVFLFVVHLGCMFSLIVASFVYCCKDGFQTLKNSWNSQTDLAVPYSSWVPCLFYGYASALLGVTGFETSANYIEEQKPGVFPKTLTYMWIVISLINPALSVLAMGVVPIEELVNNGNYSLAFVANQAVGDWFRTVIVLDSFLVLSGAVLTAYVGITGMHRRLALDRIMPNIFLATNPWRHTNHVIILTFCALTVSLRLMVSDMDTLGGVYAIAFLSVMILFCVSNLMLKWKRNRIRRSPIVSPFVPIVAGLAVLAGLVGNVVKDPENAKFFSIYFVVFAAMVLGTKMRIMILRFIARLIPSSWRLTKFIRSSVHSIRNCPMVFFTNTASLNTLNKVVQYVVENEDTAILKIMHCFDCETVLEVDPETGKEEVVCVDPKTQEFIDRLEYECSVIDRLYPKLTIELVFVNSPFSPLTVDEISREMGVPKNYMFITCPGETFPHQIGQFGGIRVISH